MTAMLSVAETKRRFSELIERVSRGERFVVTRRGKPVLALVRPDSAMTSREHEPAGLAAVAGALDEWPAFEQVMSEVYASRQKARDRPPPEFE